MKFTETMLKSYAAPLSETEDQKCKHAIDEIRKALIANYYYTDDGRGVQKLFSDLPAYEVSLRSLYGQEKVSIFIQGSYANNTCVRGESDVDIAVVMQNETEYVFDNDYHTPRPKAIEGHSFKNSIERRLRDRFGISVVRKNKSILVLGNTYRKQADTVPSIRTIYYSPPASSQEGIVIYTDDGRCVYNFPKQHIKNGREKNNNTNHYYKKMVRIAKKIRHLMSDLGDQSAARISSFGLESLLWNIPDDVFKNMISLKLGFCKVVCYLYSKKHLFSSFKEANGIKPLCPTQVEIDNYSKFIDSLLMFFEIEFED